MKNYKYILTHSSGNLDLEHSPLNWNSFNIVFKRSDRYHSVLRRQILDSDFPFDGKQYIDTIYETYGIDTDIGCEIQYLDKLPRTYATLFTGIIDLSEWSSLRDTTSVKIIDSSVMAKFASRDEIEVPINRTDDLDGNVISVYDYLNGMTVEGVNIEEKAEYDNVANIILINSAETTPFTHYRGVDDGDFDFNTIGSDADLPDVTLGSASGPIYTNNSGASITVRFRIVTLFDGLIDITGSGAWSYLIQVWTGKNGATKAIEIVGSGTGADQDHINQSYDSGYLTETLAAGETIEIYHVWSGVPGTATISPTFSMDPTLIEIFEIIDPEADTVVSMPLLHELGAKLLEIITGVSDPLNSSILGRTDSEPRTYGADGSYSFYGIASGLMLRGFRHTKWPLRTSFADFFKAIDAVGNLGCWYNGTEFQIKEKTEYYKDSKIITLGEVQDLEISVSGEDYFNKIKVGYKEVSYDEVNGQQVPNVSAEFANNTQRIQNTLDLSSEYRADDYGIELSRKKDFRTTNAEDTRFDNDNFFVVGQRDGADYISMQGYDNFVADSITGVYSPDTRLNLDITPKRNLLKHLNRLSVPLFISHGDTNFMQSQFNLDLSTQKSGDPVINETDDIAYTEEPLYYPDVYNFTSELTKDVVLQLISDPHGYVEFQYIGITYTGFIIEVSSEPFNRRGNWTLIKRNPNR